MAANSTYSREHVPRRAVRTAPGPREPAPRRAAMKARAYLTLVTALFATCPGNAEKSKFCKYPCPSLPSLLT
ncbi:unnamed protein product, partial [Iphiclides podalirius]